LTLRMLALRKEYNLAENVSPLSAFVALEEGCSSKNGGGDRNILHFYSASVYFAYDTFSGIPKREPLCARGFELFL